MFWGCLGKALHDTAQPGLEFTKKNEASYQSATFSVMARVLKLCFSFWEFFPNPFILTLTISNHKIKNKYAHTFSTFYTAHFQLIQLTIYLIICLASRSPVIHQLHATWVSIICKLKPWFPCKATHCNAKWLGRALADCFNQFPPSLVKALAHPRRSRFTAREWKRSKRHHVTLAD